MAEITGAATHQAEAPPTPLNVTSIVGMNDDKEVMFTCLFDDGEFKGVSSLAGRVKYTYYILNDGTERRVFIEGITGASIKDGSDIVIFDVNLEETPNREITGNYNNAR